MYYTSTLTQSGQITIPKPLRNLLSIKSGERLHLDFKDGTVTLRRQKTLREKLQEMDARRTPKQLASIAKDRGKTAHQIMDEYWDSPEGKEELRKINYGN